MQALFSASKAVFDFSLSDSNRGAQQREYSTIVIGQITDAYGIQVLDHIHDTPLSRKDILGTRGALAGAGKGFDPARSLLASIGYEPE